MSDREYILGAIQRNKPVATTLPLLRSVMHARDGDPHGHFLSMVEAVGASYKEVDSLTMASVIEATYPDALQIASTVPGYTGSYDLSGIDDPRMLASLDVFVCEGVWGIAENGAIWVPERNMGHRVAPFIAQHVAIVLNRDAIVDTMHEAYERISIDEEGFGVFIAGPSKTADIEQSLVKGAHGPRSLTVLLRS